MDFKGIINKIMPEVRSGLDEPFIIHRDSYGSWHCAHTRNQHGDDYEWVGDIREQDPLALEFTGKEFANGSFPHVYDTVLCNRLRVEFVTTSFTERDDERLPAFLSFFAENAGSFSQTVTDYLTTVERPLAALAEMCPISMVTEHEGWSYNEDLAPDAIGRIEKAVNDRLQNRNGEKNHEKPVPQEKAENAGNVKIWLRLGVTLDLPEAQALKILSGDEKALLSVLAAPGKANGEWYIEGESYIPQEILDEMRYDKKYTAEVDFDLPKTPMPGFIQAGQNHHKAQVKQAAQKKPATLKEKLEAAKGKAREADAKKGGIRGDKPKKRDGRD